MMMSLHLERSFEYESLITIVRLIYIMMRREFQLYLKWRCINFTYFSPSVETVSIE